MKLPLKAYFTSSYRRVYCGAEILSGITGLVGLAVGNPEIALWSAGILGASAYASYVEDEKTELMVEEMEEVERNSRTLS